MTDLLVRGIGRLLTMQGSGVGVVEDAAVVVTDGLVSWVGHSPDLPAGLGDRPELDAGGACVTPGFVDPHTHLIWAGSRRDDFVDRLDGTSYAEVAARGGGIHSTVQQTRAASYAELYDAAAARIYAAARTGTTTLEIKTGYGLSPDDECRLLDVADDLRRHCPEAIETTYLGAHAVPPDSGRTPYVNEIIGELPNAWMHNAGWCDVFCDAGAFTLDEARRILTAAREAGLGLRLHAEQIERTGAAELAAELGCASADHLDHVDTAGARAMAAAGVVGVLLPASTLTLGHGNWDAWRTLDGAGVTVALGTDCNPGTSWCESMPYVMALACLSYRMPVEAAFRAATVNAAAALRRTDVGRVVVGARGDLAILNADHEADLLAHLGAVPVAATVTAGATTHSGV
ncbi:MAG: imidazolonepropionase [Mycobacteriales bacterium]